MAFDSAETATKFLRSKAPVDEIISAAVSLIDNSNNEIYLPNKNIFIFELLCDRVNQNSPGPFKAWKYDNKIWKLLIKSWNSLASEKSLRNRVFSNVKYVELITNVFSSPESKDQEDLWKTLFKFTDLIKDQVYFDIDETSALNLLNAFVKNVLNFPAVNDSWTQTIKDLIDLQNLKITNTFSKKTYSKFISESSLLLLSFLLVHPEGESSMVIETVLADTLFKDPFVNKYFISNITQLFTNQMDSISSEQVSLLFKLTISNVSLKNIKICEELFIVIISHDKIASISEDLLSILSANLSNKSLSTDFVKSIYVTEIDSKTSPSSINWNLVLHLINLDVETAIEYGPKIFVLLSETKDQKLATSIAESVLQAYLKGREIHEFFTIAWVDAIKSNSIWKSPDFINAVSKSINSLSSIQLSKLLTDVFAMQTDFQIPLLTCIFKGLTSCPFSKVDSLKELVLKNSDTLLNTDDRAWDIYYFVLCLFGDEFAPILESRIISSTASGSAYYNTVFRLIECTGKCPVPLQEKFISSISKRYSIEELTLILNRWVIILETFFKKDQLESFIQVIFKKYSGAEIESYLSGSGEYFFEQPNLTNALTQHILNNLDKNHFSQLIQTIPIQCFGKKTKKALVKKLYTLSIETEDDSQNYQYRLSLKHLLQFCQGDLYFDFEKLIKLVEKSKSDSRQISLSIVRSIWTDQLYLESDEDNKFVKSSLDILSASTNFKYKFSITPSLEVALHLLENFDLQRVHQEHVKQSLVALVLTFYTSLSQSLSKLVSKKLVLQNMEKVDWIFLAINVLHDHLPSVDNETLISQIKEVGSQLNKLESGVPKHNLQRHLFFLSTKLYSEEHALYLISLFFILESDGLDLTTELHSYLSRLSSGTFQKAYSFVLKSAEGINIDNSAIFVKILFAFVRNSTKENGGNNLFVGVTSCLISAADALTVVSIERIVTILQLSLVDMPWLFNQYSLESTLTIITKFALMFGKTLHSPDLYIKTTQMMSSILLFHRFRLNARHHLIFSTFTSLLEPLSLKQETALSKSKECGFAYGRLLSNLCDSTNMSKEISKTSLNSVAYLIKQALRRHLPVFVINYVYLNLKYNFDNSIVEEIMPGIYSAFNILSDVELQLVSSSLDLPGKAYYRTLYDNYKDHGKWKEQ